MSTFIKDFTRGFSEEAPTKSKSQAAPVVPIPRRDIEDASTLFSANDGHADALKNRREAEVPTKGRG